MEIRPIWSQHAIPNDMVVFHLPQHCISMLSSLIPPSTRTDIPLGNCNRRYGGHIRQPWSQGVWSRHDCVINSRLGCHFRHHASLFEGEEAFIPSAKRITRNSNQRKYRRILASDIHSLELNLNYMLIQWLSFELQCSAEISNKRQVAMSFANQCTACKHNCLLHMMKDISCYSLALGVSLPAVA